MKSIIFLLYMSSLANIWALNVIFILIFRLLILFFFLHQINWIKMYVLIYFLASDVVFVYFLYFYVVLCQNVRHIVNTLCPL